MRKAGGLLAVLMLVALWFGFGCSDGDDGGSPPVNVAGEWALNGRFTSGLSEGGAFNYFVVFVQDGNGLTGTIEGSLGLAVNGSIEGNDIEFSVFQSADPGDFLNYSGTVNSNLMGGTCVNDDGSAGTWSGFRE